MDPTTEQPETLPPAIATRLRALDRAQPIVDPRTDRAVLEAARTYFAGRPAAARARRSRWAVPLSAAAAVLLAAVLMRPLVFAPPNTDDVDGWVALFTSDARYEVYGRSFDGHESLRRRVATPRGDYAGTVEAVARLVEAIESESGQRGSVGVGMPGAISPATGFVKNANSTWLNERRLHEDFEARLHQRRAGRSWASTWAS